MITDPIKSIINFNYFMLNFSHDFIEKCWKDETDDTIKHIVSKFKSFYEKKGTGLVPFFFCDLDADNQRKLAKWINENYLAFPDLEDKPTHIRPLFEMRTIKDFKLNYRDYGDIIVPKGTLLTHMTAMGPDEQYHFVNEFGWIDRKYPKIGKILKMDVESYGIDIPKEYVDKYYDFKIGNKYSERTIGKYANDHEAGFLIETNGPNLSRPMEVDKFWNTIFVDGNIAYKFLFTGYTKKGHRQFTLEEIKIQE